MITIQNIKLALFSTLMLGVTVSAHAQDEKLCAPFKNANVNQDVIALMLQAAVDGDLYRVKPGSSKMGFCINSPIGVVEAEFRDFKGGLSLDNFMQQGTSLLQVEVDSLESDSGLVEVMLKSESFLDSEQYPNITFVSTGIEWTAEKKGVLKGDLTMHGVTKEVAFYVELTKSGTLPGEETVTVKATTTIQRSEFGMYTMSSMVDDRVRLCMTIDAYKHQL